MEKYHKFDFNMCRNLTAYLQNHILPLPQVILLGMERHASLTAGAIDGNIQNDKQYTPGPPHCVQDACNGPLLHAP